MTIFQMYSFRRLAAAVVACGALAHSVYAERVFVGILEMDSYQSVVYGASAFSRVADLPIALETINATLTQNLSLPSFSGISPTETLRIVQTVDSALPLGEGNPANVALIPLSDNGEAVLKSFSEAYGTRAKKGVSQIFEHPKDTNLASRVAVAVTGHYLFSSHSPEAIDWVWKNREQLINAPPQTIPGTFRILVNPQRFADVLGTRSEKAASVINLDKLLRDFETLSFSLTLDGQALTLTLRGKPLAGSALKSLQNSLRPPAPNLWNGLPDNAFFVSLSACSAPNFWNAYLAEPNLQLMRPVTGLAPQDAFSGDRLLYLAPTKTKTGLCFVQIEPVKNVEAVRQAIQKLNTVKTDGCIELVRKPTRSKALLQIESYDVKLHPPATLTKDGKAEEPSIMFTLAALFLKQAVLEATVKDGYLICFIGPADTFENELPELSFSEKTLTLQRRIVGQDPALENSALRLGSSLHVANLLRHVVSIMPGVKPEHLRVLPLGGDGANFGIGQQDRGETLTASLRIQSNEIAALQRINRDGREVLQELFFQMFTHQMMILKEPSAEK